MLHAQGYLMEWCMWMVRCQPQLMCILDVCEVSAPSLWRRWRRLRSASGALVRLRLRAGAAEMAHIRFN